MFRDNSGPGSSGSNYSHLHRCPWSVLLQAWLWRHRRRNGNGRRRRYRLYDVGSTALVVDNIWKSVNFDAFSYICRMLLFLGQSAPSWIHEVFVTNCFGLRTLHYFTSELWRSENVFYRDLNIDTLWTDKRILKQCDNFMLHYTCI